MLPDADDGDLALAPAREVLSLIQGGRLDDAVRLLKTSIDPNDGVPGRLAATPEVERDILVFKSLLDERILIGEQRFAGEDVQEFRRTSFRSARWVLGADDDTLRREVLPVGRPFDVCSFTVRFRADTVDVVDTALDMPPAAPRPL